MRKREDGNTRYYIDIDLQSLEIIGWDFDQRDKLARFEFDNPYHYRIFISRGQYNKFEKKYHERTYGPVG